MKTHAEPFMIYRIDARRLRRRVGDAEERVEH
jgi:hypothetical protein